MKTLDMTEGKPFVLMIKFSVPMLFANVLQLLYTLADSAVIGRILGVNAFAAVGSTASPYWLAFGAILGITQGFGVVFAQNFGAKDTPGMRRAFSTAVLLSAIISIAWACGGIILCKPALAFLNTPPELMSDAVLYLSVLYGGVPVTFAYNLIGAMLRALGDSRTPLEATVLGTILNIALDFALVIPYGIAGVAAATLLAQLAACAYCARQLRNIKEARLARKNLSAAAAKTLLRLGLPLGLRNNVIEIGSLVVQACINKYGADFVAGVTAAIRMYSLLMVAGSAMDASVATFVAQNFGAGRIDRVKRGVMTGVKLMLVSSAAISAFVLVFGRAVLSFFIAGEPGRIAAVLDIGQRQLNTLALGLPVLYLLQLFRSSLEGLGNSFIPMLSGFVECIARIILVTLLTPVMGVWSVYMADPSGWFPASALLITAYLIEYRKILKSHAVKFQ